MSLSEASVTISRQGELTFAGRDANRTVIWLRGEHDLTTVDVLAETMARAIALDNADLVIDLSQLDFISAATVSAIVRARELLCQQSRSLALRAPSPFTRRILDLCGLQGP